MRSIASITALTGEMGAVCFHAIRGGRSRPAAESRLSNVVPSPDSAFQGDTSAHRRSDALADRQAKMSRAATCRRTICSSACSNSRKMAAAYPGGDDRCRYPAREARVHDRPRISPAAAIDATPPRRGEFHRVEMRLSRIWRTRDSSPSTRSGNFGSTVQAISDSFLRLRGQQFDRAPECT